MFVVFFFFPWRSTCPPLNITVRSHIAVLSVRCPLLDTEADEYVCLYFSLAWFYVWTIDSKGKAKRNLKIPSLHFIGVIPIQATWEMKSLLLFKTIGKAKGFKSTLLGVSTHQTSHCDCLSGLFGWPKLLQLSEGPSGHCIYNTTFYPLKTKDVAFSGADGINDT